MILLAIILAFSEPNLPAGASCEAIRAKVAEHGYAKAVLWAREHGYTWTQINEARKCLRWS